MNDAISRLRQARARSLFLEVEQTNLAAIALYARLGFREVGQRQGYYRKQDGSAATALVQPAADADQDLIDLAHAARDIERDREKA